VSSVEGAPLQFKVGAGGITVNGRKVIKADVPASNGVIHVIDEVILPAADTSTGNIAEVAVQAGFTDLVDLVTRANLADTLSNGGPFTVFAPTNAAFQSLDPALRKTLAMDTNLLKKVLLQHVVSGNVLSNQLSDNQVVSSVEGAPLQFKVGAGGITVNGRKVIKADVPASNGVIHVIDEVILPAADTNQKNLLEKASEKGLSTFVDLVKKSGLDLASVGPSTVFAPTNEAFAALPAATLQAVGNDPELLKNVLTYHIVSGVVKSSDLRNELQANSLNGEQLRVNIYRRGHSLVATVNGAQILDKDIESTEGVMHVIDKVLLPPAGDIAQIVSQNPRLSTLNTAVGAANLAGVLQSQGPITLFAPTNEAFAALDQNALSQLLGDPNALKNVLLGHAITGKTLYSPGLCFKSFVAANNNHIRTGMKKNGQVAVSSSTGNTGTVVEGDITARNGVVHIIDGVL